MTSFQSRETDDQRWWEVQHRWPTSEHDYNREKWSTTDLSQFGPAAIVVLREASDGGLIDRDRHFADRKSAVDFLARFVDAAVSHATISYRVAAVHAVIEIEHVVEMTPPPICGKYGYYGSGKYGYYGRGGSRRDVDNYCQKAPGHGGEHGPREAAA